MVWTKGKRWSLIQQEGKIAMIKSAAGAGRMRSKAGFEMFRVSGDEGNPLEKSTPRKLCLRDPSMPPLRGYKIPSAIRSANFL